MGLRDQGWDSRSQSPYYSVSDADDRKVMDLSNYNSHSPMMVCCGSSSPTQETVLRHASRQSHLSSPSGSRCSVSPQPSRTVITSVSSLYPTIQATSSSSPTPSSEPHYKTSPLYYMPNPHLTVPTVQHSAGSPVEVTTSSRKKKLPQPIPEECKDDAYWERRKRNNESAKRSRELRRTKEQQTSERVNYLESENLQLRTEVTMLRNEVEKLRQLLIPKSSVSGL